MPRLLNQMPSGSKWNWDELLDGKVREITRQDLIDHKTIREKFRRCAYTAAYERGLRIKTRYTDSGGIAIQAFNWHTNERNSHDADQQTVTRHVREGGQWNDDLSEGHDRCGG